MQHGRLLHKFITVGKNDRFRQSMRAGIMEVILVPCIILEQLTINRRYMVRELARPILMNFKGPDSNLSIILYLLFSVLGYVNFIKTLSFDHWVLYTTKSLELCCCWENQHLGNSLWLCGKQINIFLFQIVAIHSAFCRGEQSIDFKTRNINLKNDRSI